MHLHSHVVDCIMDYGPVYSFWLFSFERYNGLLGNFSTNQRSIELQLMRKFLSDQQIHDQKRIISQERNSNFWFHLLQLVLSGKLVHFTMSSTYKLCHLQKLLCLLSLWSCGHSLTYTSLVESSPLSCWIPLKLLSQWMLQQNVSGSEVQK